jgi:two-component system cell cycle response regulator DivK
MRTAFHDKQSLNTFGAINAKSVPRIPGLARPVNMAAMEKLDPAPRKKVLIVEDNELNMKLFNDLLEAHGYETMQARNGAEALKLAAANAPDLIIMDIQLPEISGLQATKALKEDARLAKIPVIAVTAFAMKGDEERIRAGGCEDYIAKPISVAGFLDKVKRHLG